MSNQINKDLVNKAKRIYDLESKYRKEYYINLSNKQIEDIFFNIMEIKKLVEEFRYISILIRYKIKEWKDTTKIVNKMSIILENVIDYIKVYYSEDTAKNIIEVLEREELQFGNAYTQDALEFADKCKNISSILSVEQYITAHNDFESVKSLYKTAKLLTFMHDFYYDSKLCKTEEKQIMLENLYVHLKIIPTIKDVELRNAILDYVDNLFMLGNSLYNQFK